MAQRRPTIDDIARITGTSTATVSHFLNGKLNRMSAETAESIRRAIEATGYVPRIQAQSLAGKPAHIIVVLILDNTNLWAGQIAAGVEGVATSAGYQTVFCNTSFDPERERSYVEKMLSLGADGFIVQPTTRFRALKERIARTGRPVVFFDADTYDLGSSWAKSNRYDGVYTAVSRCVEMGYRHFVYAGDRPDTRSRQERYQGFVDAVETAGLSHELLELTHGGPDADGLTRWFSGHLVPSRRTLVFVPSQWALPATYKALMADPGSVPGRVGLLGMNNEDWTDLTTPTVSTVIEPVRELGKTVCGMLVRQLGEPDAAPTQRVLDCSVRWGGTTATV